MMDTSTFINLIVGAAACMTTAIGFLFKTVIALHRDQRDMALELGQLKGKQEGIEELSNRVLSVVHGHTSK